MTGPRTADDTDERLLREALVVVHSARERAPNDFLFALAIVLGALALTLLTLGLVVGGTVADVCLNLAAEVVGAWLTVVLIDGLWSRLESDATTRLHAIEQALQVRIDARVGPHPDRSPIEMSSTERQGWQTFVGTYRDLTARASPRDRWRAARGYGHRARELTEQGEALLEIE